MTFIESNIPMYLVGADHPHKWDALDEVYPVEAADVEQAKTVLAGSRRVSARDALHISIMERHGHRTHGFVIGTRASCDMAPPPARRSRWR